MINHLASTEIARLIGAVISAVIALLTAFGIAIDPTLQDRAVELITAAGTLIATVLALMEVLRANVWSKDSAKVLANGVEQRNPSEAAKTKAAEVLNQPPPALKAAAPWAIEIAKTVAMMTPGQIDDFVLEHGAEAFNAAMEAVKRAPTSQEMTDRYVDKAKAGQ